MSKVFLIIGFIFIVIGFSNHFGFNIPIISKLGNLPGDIRILRNNFSLYIPITTCILLSIFFNLIFKLFSKI
ncbi:MAG: hypothetical protein CMF98_03155 [Candidatus Marinimicrobia bacterium]|nr:hypothetical protein [Candidatus Neomarinimicrobiota bacterium]OUW50498.1 MAG: hypothetical protein CBD50_01750 [bacterium TMED190]